jgi:hypothetical protein
MSARPNGGGSEFHDDGEGVMAGEPSRSAYIGDKSELSDIKRDYTIERTIFGERDKNNNSINICCLKKYNIANV